MIPEDYLKRIRRIEIRTRRVAEEFLVGAYRSVFKGPGVDFDTVRAYSPGDDVRLMDWNVTARLNAPYVKQYKEERELSVVLAVDMSASVELASQDQSKRELAAEVAACVAFSAVGNGDKVGLILFTDKVERYLPPRKGRRQALRIIRDVLFCEPKRRGTSLTLALMFLNHVQRRGAIVFMLSDFIDRDFERTLKVAGRRHDLIPIVITDRREQSLPDAGWIAVEDSETGEIVEVDTGSARVRGAFARRATERRQLLQHQIRRLGTDVIELGTDEPYLKPLQRFMDRRLRQRHR